MRTFWLVTLLIIFTVALAKSQTGPRQAPGLAVLEVKWTRIERNPDLEADPFLANDSQRAQQKAQQDAIRENVARTTAEAPRVQIPERPGANPGPTGSPGPLVKYVYRVTVQNTGDKSIRKVVWRYESFDVAMQRFVGRRDYVTSINIRPGQTKKLAAESSSPPQHTVNANSKEQPANRVVVLRIEYSDGTIWQRK